MLRNFFFTAVVCSLGLLLANNAQASLQVTLTAGASSLTINDGDLGVDIDPTAGIININSIVGGYSFTLTLVQSNEPGGAQLAQLVLSTASILDVGGGPTTVSILASGDGFTAPTTPPALSASSNVTANLLLGPGDSADVSFTATVDGSTVGTGSDSLSFPGDTGASMNDLSIVSSLTTTPYTITLEIVADLLNGGSNLDLDGVVNLSPVPEPTSLLVWASLAMASVAGVRRNRG